MPAIVMVLAGFVGGLLTMTVVNLYKWFFQYWNNGLR